MNTNARKSVSLKGWVSFFALAISLWHSSPAAADPIRFSTSGRFELSAGTGELTGVTDATAADTILLGSVPVADIAGPLGSAAFHIQFKFNGDLPDIDVSGTASYLGYNPDLPVLDTVVSTSATSAQVGLYPELFQRLIAHPDWLHTTSFRGDQPTMGVAMSVHPEDPGAIRPVPEPSSVLFVAMAAAGLGWRARRSLRRPAS